MHWRLMEQRLILGDWKADSKEMHNEIWKNKQKTNCCQQSIMIRRVRFGIKMNKNKIEIIMICFEDSKSNINNDIITDLEKGINQMSQLILLLSWIDKILFYPVRKFKSSYLYKKEAKQKCTLYKNKLIWSIR